MMKMVTIATFNNSQPAERFREWLEHAGIPAKVLDQRLLQKIWFLARPYSSFHVNIDRDSFEQAHALLSEAGEHSQLLAEAIRCPQCGSLRVEYPQMTRKFALPSLVAHGLTLFGIKHEFYCQACQYTWRQPHKANGQPISLPH
jgi:DNA-directed RNA polymerase subunit M/transcription elongation factor TFIIS